MRAFVLSLIVLSLAGGPFFLWLLFRKKGVIHP